MADAMQQMNPNFFDAEVQARELEQQVIAAEAQRKAAAHAKTTEGIREQAQEVLEASFDININNYQKAMKAYNELLLLKDSEKQKASLQAMDEKEKQQLVKALQFRDMMKKTDEPVREVAAEEELRLRNLERSLFADMEAVFEEYKHNGNQPIILGEEKAA